MITYLSLQNLAMHGCLLHGILACRHRNFVERQAYMHYPLGSDMEHDEYDTPATVYFAWTDNVGNVRATARLNPTDRPYMLRDKFSFMIENEPIPNSANIYEGSRICIDNDLPSLLRAQIKKELVLSYHEYALFYGVHTIIGLMQTMIMRRVYGASGCCPVSLGREQNIGPHKCLAAKMATTSEMYEKVQAKLGITMPVISNLDSIPYILAA